MAARSAESAAAGAGTAAANAPLPPCCLEDWQAQLDEILALTSILGEDSFWIVGAEGLARTDSGTAGRVAPLVRGSADADVDADADKPLTPDSLLGMVPLASFPSAAAVAAAESGGPCTSPSAAGGSGGGHVLYLQAHVHVDVPENGLRVQIAGAGDAGAFVLRHLPPVCVDLELPCDYPSASPPAVQLSASWLHADLLPALHAQLDSIWREEQAGFPVIFSWLDWLKTGTLGCMGAADALLLRQARPSSEPPQAAAPPLEPSQSPRVDVELDGSAAGCSGGKAPAARRSRGASASGGVPAAASSASRGDAASSGCTDADDASMSAFLQQMGQQQQQQQQPHPPPEQVLAQLLRFDASKEEQAFRAAVHTCGICFTEVSGASCARLRECGHFYCAECMAQHCKTQVEEGAVESLACPTPDCRRQLPPGLVRDLLGAELFARWEHLLLQRTLSKMADVATCPRCKTQTLEDEDDHCVQCPKCMFVSCALCCEAWHPGRKCMSEVARLELLAARQGGNREAAQDRQKDLLNQIASLRLLSETSKACPGCRMHITKAEGCNKMTCSSCGVYFCWKCEKVIQGYDHFQGGCGLFDGRIYNPYIEDEQPWAPHWQREVMRQPPALMQILVGGGGGGGAQPRFIRCPSCGQDNIKLGNNNQIRCWACLGYFCYVCRQRLVGNRPGAHYGPSSRCKQHSAD